MFTVRVAILVSFFGLLISPSSPSSLSTKSTASPANAGILRHVPD